LRPGFCQACEEQEAGSLFLKALNAGGETPGVSYTVIESRNDEVVTPCTSAFLSGRHVTNITLQEQWLLDQGEHLSMPYDHIADAGRADGARSQAPAIAGVHARAAYRRGLRAAPRRAGGAVPTMRSCSQVRAQCSPQK
jgi:hypothetical protein